MLGFLYFITSYPDAFPRWKPSVFSVAQTKFTAVRNIWIKEQAGTISEDLPSPAVPGLWVPGLYDL